MRTATIIAGLTLGFTIALLQTAPAVAHPHPGDNDCPAGYIKRCPNPAYPNLCYCEQRVTHPI